jgi:hypothetical protein
MLGGSCAFILSLPDRPRFDEIIGEFQTTDYADGTDEELIGAKLGNRSVKFA